MALKSSASGSKHEATMTKKKLDLPQVLKDH